MPKIVDREKMCQEIALKSAAIFLEKGYKNLGMRELSSLLGMSKSALYHYYKTKDILFNAALEAVLAQDRQFMALEQVTEETEIAVKCSNFESLFEQIEPRFFKESNLVQDYIEVIGTQNVHSDKVMILANQQYIQLIKTTVDEKHADELYTLLMGLLMRKQLEGDNFCKIQVKTLACKIIQPPRC